jgi:ATP-dependent Clp protease ATP-binding subunit ClpA
MFKRFTTPAREVVIRAQAESQRLGHTWIGSEHLLLALLSQEAGVAYQVLHEAGLDDQRVRAEIERLVQVPTTPLDAEDAAALQTLGINLDTVLARIEETFGPDGSRPKPERPRRESLLGRWLTGSPFTPRAKKIMELSLRESKRLGHSYLGVEHLLLALLRDGKGQGAKVLIDSGLRLDDLYATTLRCLPKAG